VSLYTISPQPWLVLLDAQFIIPSGQLAVYTAGTSTPATVYTTADGVAHPFPITLDSSGRVPGGLYLQPGLVYKFVLHQPKIDQDLDGAIVKTQDGVAATPNASGQMITLSVPGFQSALNVSGVSLVEYDGAGDVWITGLSGGVPGQMLVIRNLTPYTISLFSRDGSASSFNQPNYGTVTGGGTQWIVEPTDQVQETWYLEGRHLFYGFSMFGTSVVGTSYGLVRQIPLGWLSSTSTFAGTMLYTEDGGTTFKEGVVLKHGNTAVAFRRAENAPWTPTTNLTGLLGQIAIPLD
jgi:hypothetical protein